MTMHTYPFGTEFTPCCDRLVIDLPFGDGLTADESRVDCKPEPVAGMCLSCRSIEVELNNKIGARDFSDIGESAEYPVGYGCEVCE